MPPSLWNVDWLNANSQRKYPLADTATGTDITGSITLPDDFLVDLVVAIPVLAGVDPAGFHIKTIVILPQGAIITLGHLGEDLGVISVNKAAHSRYDPYRVIGQGDFYDAYGTATIGSFANLDILPAGMYSFDQVSGRLTPTTVQPDIRGVSSLRLVNGRDTSEPLTGDIYLIAGRNTRFQVSGNQVTLDALPLSTSLAEECGCEDALALAPCIKTINGVLPDDEGDMTLEGNECITITPGTALLTFLDECSEPCCGCDELKVVLDTVSMLGTNAATLRSQVIALEGIVTQLGTSISSSSFARVTKTCPTGIPYRLL